MKAFVISFVLLSFGGYATPQTDPLNRPAVDVNAQRAAIASERNRLEAGFLSEDAVCYKKFAVNRCLENVDARRKSVMGDMKKQEIMLNDEQRNNKGAEQIRRTQEKSSPESTQENKDPRTTVTKSFQSRPGHEQEDAQQRNAAVLNEAAARKANAARFLDHEKKTQARAEKQANTAEKAKIFNERQIQAQERRIQHDADQAKRVKPAAKPLPLP